MIKAKRLSHATLVTPQIDRQVAHYTEVVGLVLAHRERDRAFLATNTGRLALVLEAGAAPHCSALAFEVSPQTDAGAPARDLGPLGLTPEAAPRACPGIGTIVAYRDPKGTRIELFSDWTFLDPGPAVGGAVALKLGHVAFGVPDPQAITDVYVDALGFRVSDWIGDMFAFLRCGTDHHSVNFIRAPTARLHHLAFEMRDAAHLHNSCDQLGQRRIPIVWGPVRHGPGHNVATYHEDPDGQLVEFYAELDQMVDEEGGFFEPRPWHRDRPQRPRVWDPALQRDMWGQPPSPAFIAHAR